MLLDFERGSSAEPKGHALAYVRDGQDPEAIFATYLVVPPIAIDLAKYMPPMFASKISMADVESISAIPLPPVPERVEGLAYLKQLAERRDDDVINLGTVNTSDVQTMLAQVSDAAQEYLRTYSTHIDSIQQESEPAEVTGSTLDEILFGLMGDREKLGELTKRLGKLRYAVEGGDEALVEETIQEIEGLGSHLAAKYQMAELTAAARLPDDRGRALSELCIARCYKICDEDYLAVESIDREIAQLRSDS
jgi:hypothetical protein